MNTEISKSNSFLQSGDFARPALGGRPASLLSEDLATFLVAHHILITGNDSVSSVKRYFRQQQEILDLVDDLLIQLEASELLTVNGDKILIKKRFIDIGGNADNLRRFLPRLFELSSDRVLKDALNGSNALKREGVRYFAIPNDNETSIEAQAIYLDFKNKMQALSEKTDKFERRSESVRLVGVFNCSLVPEDFV